VAGANAGFALCTGDGGALGAGTATARGAVPLSSNSGVSDGLGELFFFFGPGESEPDRLFSALAFFFFLPFADLPVARDLFASVFAVASGVSRGVASGSSAGVFFFFALDFCDGDGDFFFLCGEVFDVGDGVGDSSAAVTARALRTGIVFS
jgi:hypothetical protein